MRYHLPKPVAINIPNIKTLKLFQLKSETRFLPRKATLQAQDVFCDMLLTNKSKKIRELKNRNKFWQNYNFLFIDMILY